MTLGKRVRPPGLFALYVAGYSAFRIFAELIRVDPAHHILGLRLNLFVAAWRRVSSTGSLVAGRLVLAPERPSSGEPAARGSRPASSGAARVSGSFGAPGGDPAHRERRAGRRRAAA